MVAHASFGVGVTVCPHMETTLGGNVAQAFVQWYDEATCE